MSEAVDIVLYHLGLRVHPCHLCHHDHHAERGHELAEKEDRNADRVVLRRIAVVDKLNTRGLGR